MSGLMATTVLTNGKLMTVDREFAVAEAVAFLDNRIIDVDTSSDMAKWIGPHTQVVDLQGHIAIPGLIDNHVHQIIAGLATRGSKLQIGYLKSIAAILETVHKRALQTPEGEWIVTTGMYRGVLEEKRFPTRWDLDKITPAHPVYLQQSGKNFILNSYAMRLAGVDRNTPEPTDPEGHIVRDEKGEPTGHFIAGAGDMVRKRLWQHMGMRPQKWDFYVFPPEEKAEAIKAQMAFYNRCGIVGVRDMGVSPEEIEAYQLVWAEKKMTTRTNLLLGLPARYMDTKDVVSSLRQYFGPKQRMGDEWLRMGGLKIVVQNDGWWGLSREKLRALIIEANRQGWTMAIHMTTGGGDEAIDLCLDILEEADRERPLAGRRCSVEHAFQKTDLASVERLKRLGFIVASNPLLTYHAAARSLAMHQAMDNVKINKQSASTPWERAVREWAQYTKDWHDAGLTVTGGSDNPAVVYDVEHPLLGMYSAITGDTLAGVLAPTQAVTREQALRMYTINNAYATFEEDIKGSIEKGKLADVVVLSADLMTVPAEAIKDIVVELTIVDGKVVYRREGSPIAAV
jgi:predicted amidohydrolase YtcJ